MSISRLLALAAVIAGAVMTATPSLGYVFTNSVGQATLDSRSAVRWPFAGEVVAELQLGKAPAPLSDGFESFDDIFVQSLVDWNDQMSELAGAPQL
ncbi:MAG TPA: hypothetical protein VEA16_18270, partial [Vicinamibacterales bacterium]|nr:hypothetical protein [Vicinamibacterales bacterium]